ncbi:cell wall protein [Microbacterium sp. CPCC 204701]|uniref:cell wall protein n=1 Tax=Microbacterium sp. CPCC 204701 TaxID=2493084 RepID=UPI001F0B910A|nr:cell wall protein [Microbacterium sp. CPCC 204701]
MVGVAAALTLGASGAANALDGYTPPPPSSATLAGTSVISDCERDAPWINYHIVLTDPDGQVTNHEAVLVLSAEGQSVEVPLGTIVGGELSGRVLWPGASVDGSGNPTGWPGWAFENGRWVETSGNYAWTRGEISALIRVNPDLEVPLAYPPATAPCADPTSVSVGTAAILPTTGSALPVVALCAGVLLVGVGGAAIAHRRRRTAR